MLNDKGQCCGRKPIVYKRDHFLFCDRCHRSYDLTTKQQIPNWAYVSDGAGGLTRKNPQLRNTVPATKETPK